MNLTIRAVNKHLPALKSEWIENDNISSQNLGWKTNTSKPKKKR